MQRTHTRIVSNQSIAITISVNTGTFPSSAAAAQKGTGEEDHVDHTNPYLFHFLQYYLHQGAAHRQRNFQTVRRVQ